MYITFFFIWELLDFDKCEDAGAFYICTPHLPSFTLLGGTVYKSDIFW